MLDKKGRREDGGERLPLQEGLECPRLQGARRGLGGGGEEVEKDGGVFLASDVRLLLGIALFEGLAAGVRIPLSIEHEMDPNGWKMIQPGDIPPPFLLLPCPFPPLPCCSGRRPSLPFRRWLLLTPLPELAVQEREEVKETRGQHLSVIGKSSQELRSIFLPPQDVGGLAGIRRRVWEGGAAKLAEDERKVHVDVQLGR
jgi:hypothetical protein